LVKIDRISVFYFR